MYIVTLYNNLLIITCVLFYKQSIIIKKINTLAPEIFHYQSMTFSSHHKGNLLHKSGKGLFECWIN